MKYGLCSVSQKLELIGKKLVLFLESAGQIHPETCLTFEAPKCVLASVIIKYYKCLYSYLSYPACKSYFFAAPHYISTCDLLCYKERYFRRKIFDHKICASIFCTSSICKISYSKQKFSEIP